ncbi:Retrovirus-related Pol polyprotein from transposon TNT 1-94, partial [Lachnellula suecica]
ITLVQKLFRAYEKKQEKKRKAAKQAEKEKREKKKSSTKSKDSFKHNKSKKLLFSNRKQYRAYIAADSTSDSVSLSNDEEQDFNIELLDQGGDIDLNELKAVLGESFETAFPAKVIASVDIPRTYKEAVTDPKYAKKWKAAMAEEMLTLYANKTFKEVIAPNGANIVSCKFVARGFSQVYGEDYNQMFALTVRIDTLRIFLAIVAAENLQCFQFDIKNAFTELYLKETIYLQPPQGLNIKKGRVWQALHKSIKLLVYVNDIVASAKKQGEIDEFYKTLRARFHAKDLGEIKKILGARVTRDRKHKTLYLDQEQYLNSILEKFGITKEKAKSRPVPTTNYDNLRPANEINKRINITEPDIAFVLGKLSQFMSDPAEHYSHALKFLFRYLKSTVKQQIRYSPGGDHEYFVLYSDADWATDKSSKKQRSIATSSCESEYIALASCVKQGQWIAQILRDLGYAKYIGKNSNLVQMLRDNQGAIAFIENAHLNDRSKHVDICYYYIRDLVENGRCKVDYIPTNNIVADSMTKPLQRVKFERFKAQIGLVEKRENA